MGTSLTACRCQMNIFLLRERDLLNQLAAEVSHHQVNGQSKEHAFILVRMHICLTNFILLLSALSNCCFHFTILELSACWGLGQSFCRSGNIANLYWSWGNCIYWFVEGKFNSYLLKNPELISDFVCNWIGCISLDCLKKLILNQRLDEKRTDVRWKIEYIKSNKL